MARRPRAPCCCPPPLNQAAAHTAKSTDTPASEPGARERSTARVASQLSPRRTDSVMATSSARDPVAALLSSLGVPVAESARSSPLAGRFILERIRPPERQCDRLQSINYSAY